VYPELEARFSDNHHVVTLPFGLGSADRVMSLQLKGLGSTVHGESDAAVNSVDVQIRDVAVVLEELGLERIDYMKINIEGAEYDLLERLIDTGWNHRVRYLLIQFHEWYPRAHIRRWRIRRKLRATHDQVWNYPWIYELWCAKDQPHPVAPRYSKAELAKIRAELLAAYESSSTAAEAGRAGGSVTSGQPDGTEMDAMRNDGTRSHHAREPSSPKGNLSSP
jgi:FkbM family methyltransferase